MTTASDDKRTAVAVLVCIMVVMVYSQLFIDPYTRPRTQGTQAGTTQSQSTQQEASQVHVPSSAANSTGPLVDAPKQTANPVTLDSSPAAESGPQPTKIDYESHPVQRIRSDKVSVEISSLGGRVLSYKLLEHFVSLNDRSPLDLISIQEGTAFPPEVRVGSIDDSTVAYSVAAVSSPQIEPGSYVVPETGEFRIDLEGTLSTGTTIKKSFTFKNGSYLFDVEVRLGAPSPDGSAVMLTWAQYISPEKMKANRFDPMEVKILTPGNSIEKLPAASDEIPDISTTQARISSVESSWIGFMSKYFADVLIPHTGGKNAFVYRVGSQFYPGVIGDSQGGSFSIFVGPKEDSALQQAGHQLQRTIDLGWFTFLAHPLLVLLRIFYSILGNYGLAIILLTLSIKAIFLPLTSVSFKSMKAMQEIQPEVKALRERIKDPTQLNQEMMKLYKKRGVNPMSGCLPMLIQIPVFLGLYNALLYSIELRHAPFALWIHDLSAPERLHMFGIGIPVMVLLWGGSMYIQQLTTPSTADPTQRKVMMMMPIVLTVMFVVFPFPAGLVLYWLVSNFITIVQQMNLRSEHARSPLATTVIASGVIFAVGFVLTLL